MWITRGLKLTVAGEPPEPPAPPMPLVVVAPPEPPEPLVVLSSPVVPMLPLVTLSPGSPVVPTLLLVLGAAVVPTPLVVPTLPVVPAPLVVPRVVPEAPVTDPAVGVPPPALGGPSPPHAATIDDSAAIQSLALTAGTLQANPAGFKQQHAGTPATATDPSASVRFRAGSALTGDQGPAPAVP